MKKYILPLALLLSLALFSCSGDGKTGENEGVDGEKTNQPAKPDWSDTRKISTLVSKNFYAKSYDIGMMHAPLTNPADNSLFYFKLNSPDTLYQTTENTAFFGVNILTDKEVPGVLDYKISWDPSFSQQDSTFGRFKITDISIRALDKKTYYNWEKKGDFWEKMYPQVQ